MSNRLERSGKALSLLIVVALALGGLLAVALSSAPAARAAVCDQGSSMISGNWVITTAQVCSGIVFTIDGNIYINSPGSLTLVDGGIVFVQDTGHIHLMDVNASASLTLDNSYISTQTNVLDPYVKLTLNVAGSIYLTNHAMFKFPGNLNLNAGSLLNLTASTVTGFSIDELANLGDSAFVDDNDDSAIIAMNGATAYLYQSTIEKIYENTQSGGSSQNLALTGSNLYAYDSFIAVDFSNDGQIHNAMTLDTASSAYLYNVTLDEAQGAGLPLDQRLPAFVPSGSGVVQLLRWSHTTVVDATGIPVLGSAVTSTMSPGTQQAQYPDNGMSTTPSAATRWYLSAVLGLTNNPYSTTDVDGHALIPLWTDRITAATLPNAQSFGNYEESAAYASNPPATGGVSFLPYPDMSVAANNLEVVLQFTDAIICSSPVTTWTGTLGLSGAISVGGTLEIAGAVTITNGNLYIDQSANACGFIQVDSGASLSLVNSVVRSNYPLVIDVTNGGTLAATQGSSLELTQHGMPGLLRSDGTTSTVSLTDTSVSGNVSLAGASATLVRDDFLGPALTIDTSGSGAQTPVRLYDSALSGVSNLSLGTDYGSVSNLAFDIRNMTLDDVQTSQLVFGGTQYVQLTNVSLDDPTGTWYLNTITEGAKVDRYWWLSLNDVDGTGTLLERANATISLWRLDPVSGSLVTAPNPIPGNTIYNTASTTWPVSTTSGQVLYRAFMESRIANPSSRVVNNTYVANGTAAPQGTSYFSDLPNAQATVTDNTVMELTFTSLTPDLSITLLQAINPIIGDSTSQPINTNITLIATIQNTGQIDVRDVDVAFFYTNVDLNGDNLLDSTTDTYRQGALIDEVVIPLVPKGGTATATVYWTPQGSFASSTPISIVVDPPLLLPDDGGAIRETNELNNIFAQTIGLFTWPDLSVTSADIVAPTDPVVNNDAFMEVTVHNIGTFGATDATVQLFENGLPVSAPVQFDLTLGVSQKQIVVWHPTTTGAHLLQVLVDTKNDTLANRDYIMSNNVAATSFNVHTQPDLALLQADYPDTIQGKQDTPFAIEVVVHNLGQTAAVGSGVAVYLDGNLSEMVGRIDELSFLANSSTTKSIQINGIHTPGNHELYLVVDPDGVLVESAENNNFANLSVYIAPPAGQVYIGNPSESQALEPGDVLVRGYVRTVTGEGIPGVFVYINVTQAGSLVLNTTATTDTDGQFLTTMSMGALPDGAYSLQVTSPAAGITSGTVAFSVHRAVPFLNQPMPVLGIQWWIFLVILAAAIAVVVGVTLYFKVYGLGKMVECGECGAFIPEDATVCPKCGVEFEKDMAKCSNCQAWIPVDVKQCPECGVEFATGQVEMADYQEKMRLQYDEVVTKFKDEAERQLGRQLSDREFQEWWRKQPTFLTFEDWLREEEEMRKMGSKPCPTCGTLNSVTATVCHKCGSLMKEAARPPGGGGSGGVVAGAPARRAAAPTPGPAPLEPTGGAQAATGAAAGSEAIPRRVIRKPIQPPQPVVQKKVIKRPMGEGQQGESAEAGEQASDETPEDEL
jgi:ribosomal protein L40E